MTGPVPGHCFPPGLRHLRHQWFSDPERIREAIKAIAPIQHFRPRVGREDFYQFLAVAPLQQAQLMSFGSADAQFAVADCAAIHLVACFAGIRRVATPAGEVACGAGGALLLPPGAREAQGSCSNAVFRLDPERIARAAAAMAGHQDGALGPARRWRSFAPLAFTQGPVAEQLHSLVQHLDACLGVEASLPSRLALDDVVHRQVAALLDPTLLEARPSDGERLQSREGRSAFDDLLDHIRANLDQPLRLSDLEARSHYSRRALQYAFRQKLNCTPMQWIRQQRLTAAMERLRQENGAASVRAVALACGYRSLSLFSADFQRRFGLPPSRALRRSL